ncbi:Protein of uncharacterised function (DUF2029) [Pandoraea pnomenusa]|uniref:Protein of uncharacterized function (DUF2029) n=2 Tax=Burkholderiaceae TaxID=119060 RepID=A0A378YZ17_9BURK|nr:Protein of uncharacterised function (DUF2029) [Pandoraea pnomenusa]
MKRQASTSDISPTCAGDDAPTARSGALPRVAVPAAAVMLALQLAALGAWALSWLTSDAEPLGASGHGMPPLGHDLRVFWTVSWITRHLGPLAAFDPTTLFPELLRFFPAYPDAGHWLYPPPFQWGIQPLSWLSYPAAYAVYVVVSLAAYVAAVRIWRGQSGWPWLVALAFPGLWIALLAGQNSLVTLLLMCVALTYGGSRPSLAGLCGGLLVIKPQLALLLPLWWICAGQWRALTTMVVVGAVACGLSMAWAGWPLWRAFFLAVARFNTEVVQQGAGGIWHAMPTVFAMARLHGVGLSGAYVLYAVIALPSVLFTAWLWTTPAPPALRVAAATTATLLAQPYLLYYELAWLVVPLMGLTGLPEWAGAGGTPMARSRRAMLHGASTALAWLVWIVPLQAYLAALWPPMGQWGVVLLPLTMLWIVYRALRWWRAHNGTHCPRT